MRMFFVLWSAATLGAGVAYLHVGHHVPNAVVSFIAGAVFLVAGLILGRWYR